MLVWISIALAATALALIIWACLELANVGDLTTSLLNDSDLKNAIKEERARRNAAYQNSPKPQRPAPILPVESAKKGVSQPSPFGRELPPLVPQTPAQRSPTFSHPGQNRDRPYDPRPDGGHSHQPPIVAKPVKPKEPWDSATSVESLLQIAAGLPLAKRKSCEDWVADPHREDRIAFLNGGNLAIEGGAGGGLRFMPFTDPVMVLAWQPTGDGRVALGLAPLVGSQLVCDIPLVFGKLVQVEPAHADPSWTASRVLEPAFFQVAADQATPVLNGMRGREVPDAFRKLYVHAEADTLKYCRLEAHEPR